MTQLAYFLVGFGFELKVGLRRREAQIGKGSILGHRVSFVFGFGLCQLISCVSLKVITNLLKDSLGNWLGRIFLNRLEIVRKVEIRIGLRSTL